MILLWASVSTTLEPSLHNANQTSVTGRTYLLRSGTFEWAEDVEEKPEEVFLFEHTDIFYWSLNDKPETGTIIIDPRIKPTVMTCVTCSTLGQAGCSKTF
jgi:hypothetical protein